MSSVLGILWKRVGRGVSQRSFDFNSGPIVVSYTRLATREVLIV